MSVFKNLSITGNISFAQKEDYLIGVGSYSAGIGDLDRDGKPDLAVADHSDTSISVLRSQVTAPYISSFKPIAAGKPGTTMTLAGINFSGTTAVSFGGTTATSFNVESDTTITAVVGKGATGSVSVITPEGTDTLGGFTYTTEPFIFSFSPHVGETGTTVTITGINFTGTTGVDFGGVPVASFTVESDTTIKAVIGAGTAGSVSVTTALGTGTLSWFTFAGAPVITSFTPTFAPIGKTVTINGKNFNDTAEDNIVYFGAVKATISKATDSSLTLVIPSAAAYQATTVLNKPNGLIGYSGEPFMVTTPDGGNPITDSSFVSSKKYSTESGSENVSRADFDGDGKLDIVVTNSTSNTVSVFRNIGATGTISFAEKASYATGLYPASIATGDLDGDGKPDLAVANTGDQTISVFRNTSENGIISFAAKADYITGSNSNSLAIGDLDADGKPDVVVAGYYTYRYIDFGKISVFKNFSTPGSIFFASKVDYSTNSFYGDVNNYPNSVSLGDLNGDGKPEVVVANFYVWGISSDYYSEVTVFKNTSTTGVLSLAYPVGYNISAIDVIVKMAMGDLDTDHKPDLAILDDGGYVAIFKNTGTDSTISFAPGIDYSVEEYYFSDPELAIGDLNGDAMPDIAVVDYGVYILRNTGRTTLSFAEAVAVAGGTDVSIGDFDEDGKCDLATVSSDTVSIWKNLGGASFAVASKVSYTGTSISFTTLTTAATSWQWDFDGDGKFDSREQNPQHTYLSAGTFMVKLRVNNDPLLDKIIPITILPDRGTPYTLAEGGNFETNVTDFAADNPTGSSTFSLGNSVQPGKDSTHSGLNAWVLDIDNPTYTDNAVAYLYTPSFNCTAIGNYTLTFYAKYHVVNTVDGFRIEYSTDKGTHWKPLGTTIRTDWYDYTGYSETFPAGQAFFSLLDADSYTKKTFKTTAFEGNPTVAFRFVFKSAWYWFDTNEAGLAIDDFTLTGPANDALPVNLISFTGLYNGNKNILNWKTATEINSSRYEIERSIDGRNFEKIGTVKSLNNTNGSSYGYDDNISHIYSNNFYYRLRMIDNDGGYAYSNVVSINVHGRNEKILVLGNLTGSYINVLTPASLLSKPLQAEILNLNGVVVKKVTISDRSKIIYVNTLASGKYYIRFIQGEKIIQTEQFVKQ